MTKISSTFALICRVVVMIPFVVCLAATTGSQNSPEDSEKESAYFPLSVGNWWVYTFGGHSKMAGKTLKWRVTDRENRGSSFIYYLSSAPSLGEDEPFLLSPVGNGIVEAGSERFLLKYPLKAGAQWEVRLSGPRFVGKLDSFQVVSDAKACKAGGHSFDHCVVIREADEVAGFVTMTTYARGVGPVKYVYFKGLHSKEIDTTLTIKSWKVQQ